MMMVGRAIVIEIAIKKRTDTKKELKNIESDIFIWSNRGTYNIENNSLIALKLLHILILFFAVFI